MRRSQIFDLVRTGKAADEIDGFVVSKHELFPIPQDEIDLAGGNWLQNQDINIKKYEFKKYKNYIIYNHYYYLQ